MKLFKKETNSIVRIQFGNKSVAFQETSVTEVMDVAIKVFKNTKVTKTINIENACPLDPPRKEIGINIYVREEGGAYKKSGYKGKSKNKTIYGLKEDEALAIFLENYEKYL